MNKDMTIISQTAGKLAAHIVSSDAAIAAVRNGVFAEIHENVLCTLLAAVEDEALHPSQLAPVVQLESVTTPSAAMQTQDAAIQKVLAQIPDALVTGNETGSDYHPGPVTNIHEKSSTIEMLEDALFHNPTNWKVWDTPKATMNGGTSPDITHETIKKSGTDFKIGVFMLSKFGSAPEWAWTRLGKQAEYAGFLATGKLTA